MIGDSMSLSNASRQVDLVYTWVNTTDPAYQAARDAMQRKFLGPGALSGWSATRDHGELKLSLRSVEQHAPFVRHVWIVTSGQAGPNWLDTSNGSATVVDGHALLADVGGWTPNFNNQALYLVLHRIRGLSEVFLVADDDFIFTRPATLELFIQGEALVHYHFELLRKKAEGTLLPEWRGAGPSWRGARSAKYWEVHTFRPYRRSDLRAMWAHLPKECRATTRRPFRSADDLILPSVYPHFVAALDPARIAYRSVGEMNFSGAETRLQQRTNIPFPNAAFACGELPFVDVRARIAEGQWATVSLQDINQRQRINGLLCVPGRPGCKLRSSPAGGRAMWRMPPCTEAHEREFYAAFERAFLPRPSRFERTPTAGALTRPPGAQPPLSGGHFAMPALRRRFGLPMGHRGVGFVLAEGASIPPENTLASLAAAAAAGVCLVEVDLALLGDGTAVLHHTDKGLFAQRCKATRSVPMRSLRRKSLANLSYAGARVPTLAEGLAYARAAGLSLQIELKHNANYRRGRACLEAKGGATGADRLGEAFCVPPRRDRLVDALLTELRRARFPPDALAVSSFEPARLLAFLREARGEYMHTKLVLDGVWRTLPSEAAQRALFGSARAWGIDSVSLLPRAADARLVRRAQSDEFGLAVEIGLPAPGVRGFCIHEHTVGDGEIDTRDLDAVMAMRPNVVCTDRPDLVLRHAQSSAGGVPPPATTNVCRL